MIGRVIALIPLLTIPAIPAYPDAAAIRAEVNALRADPGRYAVALKAYRALFDRADPLLVHLPGEPLGRFTNEGSVPVDEAIALLTVQPPLPPLASAPVLAMAARDYVALQGPTGEIGHRTGNSSPGERVRRLGGSIYVAEAISYGEGDARDIVRRLLVDDGVGDRGHRRALLSGEYHYVGIACGPHARYDMMCVFDFGATATGDFPAPKS